ncbi:MAG: hypothetical protein F6J90_29710 [Moorea sp. SIOASIH]|uniref:WD40 repeat domain-containing protein n=1 Tax=Moorena sp. SIOASIH TaxID=2607817 RepID=UPI0013BAA594|nr:WD40 repeat domain-containing protein [Moorena sp. SIOASIH]NEO40295.1 hypothetical protein [Moorena sp. SIOASIH]
MPDTMPDTISSSDDNTTATFTKHKSFPYSYKQTIVVDNSSYPYSITIETNHTWIERAVVSPDGQQLITAGRDGSIRIWDFKVNEVPDSSDNPKVFWSSHDFFSLRQLRHYFILGMSLW